MTYWHARVLSVNFNEFVVFVWQRASWQTFLCLHSLCCTGGITFLLCPFRKLYTDNICCWTTTDTVLFMSKNAVCAVTSWWVSTHQRHCRSTDRRHPRLRSTSSFTTRCSRLSGTGWYCCWRSTRPSWSRTTSRSTTRRATRPPSSSLTPSLTSSSSSTSSSTSTRRSSVQPAKSSPTREWFGSTTSRLGSSSTCYRAYHTILSMPSIANTNRYVLYATLCITCCCLNSLINLST